MDSQVLALQSHATVFYLVTRFFSFWMGSFAIDLSLKRRSL
jgi:hypothetical protein